MQCEVKKCAELGGESMKGIDDGAEERKKEAPC
jgi:hypothetical protein